MNEKTEITPLEFEFEAARRALEELRRKLEEHEYRRDAAGVVALMTQDLDRARRMTDEATFKRLGRVDDPL